MNKKSSHQKLKIIKPSFSKNNLDLKDPTPKLSFKYYANNHCEISNLEKARSNKILTLIKDIGKQNTITQVLEILKNHNTKVVDNFQNIRQLRGVPADAKLWEIKYDVAGSKSCTRLFYFFQVDTFHVALILNNTHI